MNWALPALLVATLAGCTSARPTPTTPLVPADSPGPAAEPQPRVWSELVGECALTTDSEVYCLREVPDAPRAFEHVPALSGAARLADDPGCAFLRSGELACVNPADGSPRAEDVADPSRIATRDLVRVVSGCVINAASVRRCDFGNKTPALSNFPVVYSAVDVDVDTDGRTRLVVVTLQRDGTLVHDEFDFQTGQYNRWTEKEVEQPVRVVSTPLIRCVVDADDGVWCAAQPPPGVNPSQLHPSFGKFALDRSYDGRIAAAGPGACAITPQKRLECVGRLPVDVEYPGHKTFARDPVTITQTAVEVSMGPDFLCVRSQAGLLACAEQGASSDMFGLNWRDIPLPD